MQFINSDKALQTLKAMQGEITVIETEAPVMLTQLMGYVRSTVLLNNERKAQAVANFYLNQEGKTVDISIEEAELGSICRALTFLGYELDVFEGQKLPSAGR